MTATEIPRPPWERPLSKRAARTPLSRDAIVDAAFAIVDREGAGALSMRRVAVELGTGPASLYAHVNDKEELENLIIDRIAGEVPLPVPDPARWREQVKQLLTDHSVAFGRHPGAAAFAIARIPYGPSALERIEVMLTLLRMGGISDHLTAYAADLLYMYVTAHAYEEGIFRSQGKTEESERAHYQQLERYFASLPTSRFPNLVQLSSTMFNLFGPGETEIDRFELGLEVLLSGLEAVTRLTGQSAGDQRAR
jgi:AcrR family transcriptional regulator